MHSLPKPANDLQRRILNFLHHRGVGSVRKISVDVDGGVVTLRGTVSTFYERQICISCCEHVSGVLRLIDKLNVQRARTELASVASV